MRCPQCQREMAAEEVAVCLTGGQLDGLLQQVQAAGAWLNVGDEAVDDPEVDAESAEAAQRDFLRAAGAAHMKRCPRCRAAIVKDGGCDRMHCICGHIFNWSEADSIVPCHMLHPHPVYPFIQTTCSNCSLLASAKLVLWRLGLLAAGVFVVPLVVAAGVAILVVISAGRMVLRICTCCENAC